MNPSAPPQVHKQNFQEAVPHVHTAATPEPSTRDLAPSTPDPTPFPGQLPGRDFNPTPSTLNDDRNNNKNLEKNTDTIQTIITDNEPLCYTVGAQAELPGGDTARALGRAQRPTLPRPRRARPATPSTFWVPLQLFQSRFMNRCLTGAKLGMIWLVYV